MNLPFDPGDPAFKDRIREIPGYPAGEALPIRAMVFESGALNRLPDWLALAGALPDRPLVVVMDRTPMHRVGEALKPQLLALLRTAGWRPEPLWLEADASGQVHADFKQIDAVLAALGPESAVLSVGSGVVTDVAKHACHLFAERSGRPLPLTAFQTANSVSAFTSNMAPLFVDGVKRTLPSRYPDVLVCDLETLRDAPSVMTAAGVGDLLAAFSSFADWYLAHRLGQDDGYSEFAHTLLGPLDDILLDQAEAIRTPTLEGMAVLARLISLAGIGMSLSHTTAPLSGFEHVISHVLDLIAEREGRPFAQHGSQVALSTLLTTACYRKFLVTFSPSEVRLETAFPSAERMKSIGERAFSELDTTGSVAAECWSDYRLKLAAWHERREQVPAFLADWPAIRNKLNSLTRPPELIRRIIQAVAGPLDFDELDPPVDRKDVQFAFRNAPLIRKRFSLGDMFTFLNWDQQALWSEAVQELDMRAGTKNRSLVDEIIQP